MAEPEPPLPRTIGRYEIVKELGRGAMGVVYQARDPQIGRLVVVKVIRIDAGGSTADAQIRERFRREAGAAGRLSHPAIVAVHDVGRDDATGVEFIAMEHVAGATLQHMVSAGATMPLHQVLTDMLQVADGLDYAHSQGIVHRDVKPSNILIREDGKLKIADFGVARVAASDLTKVGQVLGSPAYMSPEQITGATVDGRSDQFSLAIVVYQLLTGQLPFDGQNVSTIFYKVAHVEPVPPAVIRPDLPRAVSDALMRALAKDPAARYPSCRDLILALHSSPATATSAAAATVPSSPLRAATPAAPRTPPRAAPPARSSGGRTALVALATAALALGAIVVSAVFIMMTPDTGPRVSAPGRTGAPHPTSASRAAATRGPDVPRGPENHGGTRAGATTPAPRDRPAPPDPVVTGAGADPSPGEAPAPSPERVDGAPLPVPTQEPRPPAILDATPDAGEAAPMPRMAPMPEATPTPAASPMPAASPDLEDPGPSPLTPEEAPATPLLTGESPPPIREPESTVVPPEARTPAAPSTPPARDPSLAYVIVPKPGDPLAPGSLTESVLIVAVADFVRSGRVVVHIGPNQVLDESFEGAESDVGVVELPGLSGGARRTSRRFPMGITAGEHEVTVRITADGADVTGAGIVEVAAGQVCTLDVGIGGGKLMMRRRCE